MERAAALLWGLRNRQNSPQCLYAHLVHYPAIAEAFYSQIPLIVISADRPQSKIDIRTNHPTRECIRESFFACQFE
jgi:2-succinyl-5-enolpyruvyl-6-hydroxy-3-cyclohexene-1-carboxylate synthase